MPHLSPISWLLMFMTIFMTILALNSMLWWKSKPKFINMKTSNKLPFNMWSWL